MISDAKVESLSSHCCCKTGNSLDSRNSSPEPLSRGVSRSESVKSVCILQRNNKEMRRNATIQIQVAVVRLKHVVFFMSLR